MSETKDRKAPAKTDKPVATRVEHSVGFADEMDRMFENWFGGRLSPFRADWPFGRVAPSAASPFDGRLPCVDVVDRNGDVVVRAELPGVARDDLEVSVDDECVTIRAKSRHEETTGTGDYRRREIASGSFARTLALPAGVDSTRAKATFKDGLLEVTMPKQESAKRRQVPIA